MNKFWTWLAKFAYRRIKSPVTPGIGFPGLRDPDHRCDYFAPRKRITSDADCESDGHYLCAQCALYDWGNNPQNFTKPKQFK